MPKKNPTRKWIIPMSIKLRGYAIVEAPSQDAALAKAEGGEFEFQDSTCEMTDWETRGDPALNE